MFCPKGCRKAGEELICSSILKWARAEDAIWFVKLLKKMFICNVYRFCASVTNSPLTFELSSLV